MTQTVPYHLPRFAELLRRIGPRAVLDFGVRDGLWPQIVRRVVPPAGGRHCRVEGALLGAGFVPESVAAGYDRILRLNDVGHAAEALGGYDVILVEDALTDLPRAAARNLLGILIGRSQYVLVSTPLDGLSAPDGRAGLEEADFLNLSVLQRTLTRDAAGRRCGWFVLSQHDPLQIGGQPFDGAHEPVSLPPAQGTNRDLEHLLARTRQLKAELRYVKNHSAHRLADRLRRSSLWQALRWLRGRDRVVGVRALGTKNDAAQGCEVWLLSAAAAAGGDAVPWDFVTHDGAWQNHPSHDSPSGVCLLSRGGALHVPGEDDPELLLFCHPWAGQVEIAFQGRSETIDLFAPIGRVLRVYPARTPMCVQSLGPGARQAAQASARSAAQVAFVQRCLAERAAVAAVHCPRWLGVTQSTRRLFDVCYPVPESVDDEPYRFEMSDVVTHAEVLLDAGIRHVVFSGGDEQHYRIFEALRQRDPAVRCDLLWHGNFVQFSEDYGWRNLQRWIEAARAGHLHSVSTLKLGMERFFAACGLRSFLLSNFVPEVTAEAAPVSASRPQIGMWLSGTLWKSPFPMLASLALVPGAELHAAGLDARCREVLDFFELTTARFDSQPLPHDQLLTAMRNTHATLYVTFCECSPMLPLESLSVGVPCLVGPSSHLFADDPWLAERLIVAYPDRPDVIARSLRRVLDERDEIVRRYAEYVPGTIASARAALERFLAG